MRTPPARRSSASTRRPARGPCSPAARDWHALTGIAVGPSGTIYVSAQGGRSGVFSLTAPGFAITPLATTSPSAAVGLASSGQTLYSLDPAGVVSIDTNSPFARKVVAPDVGKSPSVIAASGSTVYGTWADGCSARRDR